MPHVKHYEVYEDDRGEFRWRLVAKNNKITADSGEGYVSASNAVRAVQAINIENLPIDIVSKDEG